jgi:hypothetical protein
MWRVFDQIWAIFACAASFAMCGLVVYFLITGRHDRDREEEAREFFDAHGYWPDEDPTSFDPRSTHSGR